MHATSKLTSKLEQWYSGQTIRPHFSLLGHPFARFGVSSKDNLFYPGRASRFLGIASYFPAGHSVSISNRDPSVYWVMLAQAPFAHIEACSPNRCPKLAQYHRLAENFSYTLSKCVTWCRFVIPHTLQETKIHNYLSKQVLSPLFIKGPNSKFRNEARQTRKKVWRSKTKKQRTSNKGKHSIKK